MKDELLLKRLDQAHEVLRLRRTVPIQTDMQTAARNMDRRGVWEAVRLLVPPGYEGPFDVVTPPA